MKIACISYEYGNIVGGGIWNVITQLSHHISLFLSFHVFHLVWCNEEKGFVANVYRVQDKIHKKILLGELAKYLQDEGYNILHAFHVGETVADVLENVKNKQISIPIIYSVHSLLKYERDIRPSRDVDIKSEERIFNACDKICYLNEFSRSHVENSYPYIKNKPYSIIQNGIDLPPLDVDRFSKKDIVLCISRWAPGKGLEYFIDAVGLVAEKFPNKRFIVAGRKVDSWEYLGNDYISFIDKKINEAKCPIEVLGWLQDSEKRRIYLESCVCVVPSELEYFPYSILEPMSLSVPVVCSDLDSIQEFFSNEDCMYFEAKKVKSLANSICTVLGDIEETKSSTRRAWRKLIDLSWDRITEKYLEVYQETSLLRNNASIEIKIIPNSSK